MKLEIYGEVNPPEAVVRLRLVPAGRGAVTVEAVGVDGNRAPAGGLVTFQADGTLTIEAGVNSALGFILDAAGRIKSTREF